MICVTTRLDSRLEVRLAEHFDCDAMTQHLSITTFRYVPQDLRTAPFTPEAEQYLNRLNQDVLARGERSGEAFLSNAMVNGRFALRACIVNFRTSVADIDALLPLLARLGREADTALRSTRAHC